MSGFSTAHMPTDRDGYHAPLGHLEAAARLAARFKETIRWVPDLGAGRFVWRKDVSARWECDGRAHEEVLNRFADEIERMALQMQLRAPSRRLMTSMGFLDSVSRAVAMTQREMRRAMARWDEVSWELQTPESVWDLRTGQGRALRDTDFNQHCTAVEPGVLGSATRWTGVLDSMFGADTDQRRWFEDLLGGGLHGHNDEQLLCWLIGRSGTGKSTVMSVIVRVLGSYATVGDSSILVRDSRQTGSRSAQSERFQLAALDRKRLVVFEEIREKHGALNTALIKKIVSSAEIMVEEKYGAPRGARLCVSPWLVTNSLPDKGLDGDDGASVLRRLGLVSADGLPGLVEPGLGDWIVEHEAPGVLAWLIDCAVRHAMFGPVARPEMSDLVSRDFTEEGRPVEDWFTQRVIFTGNLGDRLHASVMWEDFQSQGAGGVSHANFYRRLSVLIIEDLWKGDRTAHSGQMEIDGVRGSGYRGVMLAKNVENGGQNWF